MIIVVEPGARKTVFSAFGAHRAATFDWSYGHETDEASRASRLRDILRRLSGDEPLEALSFRLHSGGSRFRSPVRIDATFPGQLSRLAGSFPLYIPPVARLLRLFSRELKDVPQFAFFETSFFAGLPQSEKQYPVADKYCLDSGIMKRGFHGIFHEANAGTAAREDRMLSVVLDRHTTVCAIRGRAPVAVSLGFSPLEGIMSLKSCGDVDPGIIVYLMKEQGFSLYRIDELLKNKSGFYGMTGYDLPPDGLIRLYGKVARVTLAFDVYKNQLMKHFGDYIALLGGLDSIVFAGRYVRALSPFIYRLAREISFLEMHLIELPWDLRKEFLRVTGENSKRHIFINTREEAAIIARKTGDCLRKARRQ
ncbi:MAG: hypothetical protein ACYC5N_01445 [Endomicrobiales bacterium]